MYLKHDLPCCPHCGSLEPNWNAPQAFDAKAEIIEECAKVAEDFETHAPGTAWIMDEIAAEIRKLSNRK